MQRECTEQRAASARKGYRNIGGVIYDMGGLGGGMLHAPLKPRRIQSKCKAVQEAAFVCHFSVRRRPSAPRRSADPADRYSVSDRLLHSIWS